MFNFNKKLDDQLKFNIKSNCYKNFRVLINCKNLCETMCKKIISYNGTVLYCLSSINTIVAIIGNKAIYRLIEFPEISYISLDNFAILCGTPVLSSNFADEPLNLKLTGKGVSIGIVDSGVYPHPDLTYPHNKIIKFLDLINHYHYPYDDNGHGTFISGVISGIKGVSKGSKIYMIKAFNGQGKAYVGDLLFSIITLLEDSKDLNIKVICLPFELIYNDSFTLKLFSALFDMAISNNVIIVLPIGNNGDKEDSIRGIASLKNCITAGSVDTTQKNIKACSFSSKAYFHKIKKPDFVAAGYDIMSLNSNSSFISEINGKKIYPKPLDYPYTSFSGTSCAAAYIAAVCSLLIEDNPKLTFNDVYSILKVSCKTLDLDKSVQGHGFIDIYKCFTSK